MKPVFQNVLHDPPKSYGNCYQAALSSLMELPMDIIPHFAAMSDDEWSSWQGKLRHWFENFGFKYMGTGRPETHDLASFEGVDGYVIVGGLSPRGNWNHAVIYHKGVLVHDPHPSQAGILSITDWDLITRL